MVDSAKRFGYEMIQMSDLDTPPVRGADRVIRLYWDGGKFAIYKLTHLSLLRFPCMVVDTDVIFQSDVSRIMDADFDVCLTRRYEPILDDDGFDVTTTMPYNCGVMFSKNHLFWKRGLKRARAYDEKYQHWWGEQLAVREVAESGQFNVVELDCFKYNYTPEDEGEDVSQKHLVHYKGKRKDWMLCRSLMQTGPA